MKYRRAYDFSVKMHLITINSNQHQIKMTRPKSNLGYRQVKTKTAGRYREKKNPPNSVLEEEAQSVPEYEQQSASTPEEESVLDMEFEQQSTPEEAKTHVNSVMEEKKTQATGNVSAAPLDQEEPDPIASKDS